MTSTNMRRVSELPVRDILTGDDLSNSGLVSWVDFLSFEGVCHMLPASPPRSTVTRTSTKRRPGSLCSGAGANMPIRSALSRLARTGVA